MFAKQTSGFSGTAHDRGTKQQRAQKNRDLDLALFYWETRGFWKKGYHWYGRGSQSDQTILFVTQQVQTPH